MAPKHRLLLADDSVTIQKVVNLTFADEGIEVVAVGDGDAAMQKFVEAVPDLVMVDVNMPGASGYQICEMIKQDDETKHIPVILLVGSFEPFDEAEARRVGADDFLTKPFQSIRQLVNKVSDLLKGSTGDGSGGESAGSFNDTLELIPSADNQPSENLETSEEEEAGKENFGDAAMDDDLIQTNQIGSLPADEAVKIENASNYQSRDEFEQSYLPIEAESEDASTVAVEENLTETVAEKNEFSPAESFVLEDHSAEEEILPRHENIYEFADENFADEAKPEENNLSETIEADDEADEINERTNVISEYQNSTYKEAVDDFDLLELNPSKNKRDDETENNFRPPNDVVNLNTPQEELSPEMIELIADRVIEKLSEETIEKIVREVFVRMVEKR